jgi:hypothetical protein
MFIHIDVIIHLFSVVVGVVVGVVGEGIGLDWIGSMCVVGIGSGISCGGCCVVLYTDRS